jgi:hypothetical protein
MLKTNLEKPVFFTVLLNYSFWKCGAGEGWRRSIETSRVTHEEVLQRIEEEWNILHTIEGVLIGLVAYCVDTLL